MIGGYGCLANEVVVNYSVLLQKKNNYGDNNHLLRTIRGVTFMKRGERARVFRQRLEVAMQSAGVNRSQLAEAVGIDRSTLSQLLNEDGLRMPRADTVAAVAEGLQVSLDWLMGLSAQQKPGATILQEFLQVSPAPKTMVDQELARWHEEAVGYKIRYVPSNLPDLAKTAVVNHYEFEEVGHKRSDQAVAATQEKLEYTNHPDSDLEICMPGQALEAFAAGQGQWSDLETEARIEQLDHLQDLVDRLYPGLRIFLFDARENFSAPYTVFGPKRAAVYLGQMYFVFNTTDHIRVLIRHFDDLVRAAIVQSNEVSGFLRTLRAQIAQH